MSNNQNDTPADKSDNQTTVSRRTALSLLGVGGLGLATGQAAGKSQGGPPFYNWREDVDANGNALEELGALEMADNPTAICDFAGENLEIDDGVLNADVDTDPSPVFGPGYVHVDEFGAKGDGETDDTDAIQAAVDSLDEGETGVLTFTAGNEYYITDTINVDVADIRAIEGNNAYLVTDQDITVLRYTGSFSGTASPDSGNVPEIAETEIGPYVRGLQIYNDGPYEYTESPYEGTGMEFEQTFGLNVSDCHIFRMHTGIRVVGANRNLNLYGNRIYDNLPYGIHFSGVNLHQVNAVANHVSYAVIPIYFEDSAIYNLQLTANDVEVSSTGSESCIGFDGGSLIESQFDGNTIQGHNAVPRILDLAPGGGQYLLITDNHLSNCAEDAIHIDAGGGDFPHVTVADNTFKQVTEYAAGIEGDDLPHFKLSGNSVDTGRGFHADIGSNAGPIQVTDNTIGPDAAGDVISISGGDGLRSIKVVDNTVYPSSVGIETDDWLVQCTTPNDAESVIVANNQFFARGGGFNGVQLSADGFNGIIVKNNVAREIASDATAYDVPDEDEGSVIVTDNLEVP